MSQCNCSNHGHKKKDSHCSCHDSHSCCSHEKEGGYVSLSKSLLIFGTCLFVLAVVSDLFSIPYLPEVLYITAYFLIGFETLSEFVASLREREFFSEATLMIVSSFGAMLIGEMSEACMVMLLFAVGEMLEQKARQKSKKNIEQMLSLRPKYAERLNSDGSAVRILPEELEIGDTVLVKAGDTVPCDGKVIEGCVNIDTSSITGESIPVIFESGKEVRCGYICLDGSLKIKVTTAYEDNTFSKILLILSESGKRRSKSETFISGFAKIYTPVVIILSLLVTIIGSIVTSDISGWVYRGLVFLATSCPCAFVISVPLSFFFGLGEMTKIGLLVKGSEFVEKLSNIRLIAFDKTGTVTGGCPVVVGITCADGYSPEKVLSVCSSVEINSSHPIALSIIKFAKERDVEFTEASVVREIPGKGIAGKVGEIEICCGNEKLLTDISIFKTSDYTTKVYVSEGGKAIGVIELSDEMKPEVPEVIRTVKKLGVDRTVMLTGDSASNVYEMASKCGIDEVHSGLEPQQKSEILGSLISAETNGYCAFVGDGMNDAPVLNVADIGIAVGGTGAEISVEAADAVILGSSLDVIPKGIKAARIIMSRVKFNVLFAVSIKVLIMLLSFFGYTDMGLAVFGDVGVTIIVILNSLRRFRL